MTEPKPRSDERVAAEMKKRPLFFDIETTAHPRVKEWIVKEKPDLSSVRAPSNYKDPQKISDYVRKAQETLIAASLLAHTDKIAKAPLDADYGVIRAIGYREGVEGPITVMIVPKDIDAFLPPETFGKDHLVRTAVFDTEGDMLSRWWQLFKNARKQTVGYNSIGFDFPYLLRRSMDLRVKPSLQPDLRRYQYKGNMDLMAIMFNWGRAKGMKFVCKRYGIENPNPELDGSQVANMDDATLVQYAAGDIYMLTEIHRLMDGFYW